MIIKYVLKRQLALVRLRLVRIFGASVPDGTMITMSRMMMPTMMQIRIFMFFHIMLFLVSRALLLKCRADSLRASVLAWRVSSRVPRSPILSTVSVSMDVTSRISYKSDILVFCQMIGT
jgi:hypothetical protein